MANSVKTPTLLCNFSAFQKKYIAYHAAHLTSFAYICKNILQIWHGGQCPL